MKIKEIKIKHVITVSYVALILVALLFCMKDPGAIVEIIKSFSTSITSIISTL